jgi:serine/threonine protein kinase
MQPEELVGQTLGHYHIKKLAGQGGMATVYQAEDIHLGREVAIKAFLSNKGETQDFLRRFAREARVLAQLDHPQILPVYDYGEQSNMAFLVTPYLPGGSLKEMLEERKVLPPSEAVKLIEQVLSALQYAHDRNLIHRDIKPGNLLFKSDGTLVLADFGLVKVIEGDGQNMSPLMTLSNTNENVAGTPDYMAPEQIEGKVVAASDIYALGIVLYEMVTGLRPFTGDSLISILMKHIHEQPRPPRQINPYISTQLEAVILRALEKDLSKRFARPAEFLQALKPVLPNRASNPGIAGIGDFSSGPDGATSIANPLSLPGNRVSNPTSNAGLARVPAPFDGPLDQRISNPASNPGFARPGNPAFNAEPTALNTYNQARRANWPQSGAGNFAAPSDPFSTPQIQTPGQPDWGNNFQGQPQNPSHSQNWQAPGQMQVSGTFLSQQKSTTSGNYGASNQPWTQAPGSVPAPFPAEQQTRHKRTPLIVLLVTLLLLAGLASALFLTPLGSKLLGNGVTTTPGTNFSTPAFGSTVVRTQATPTTSNTTLIMPATSIDCPANGNPRPAVTATLKTGSKQSLLYLVNDTTNNIPNGVIKIYNPATQKKTTLVTVKQALITEAQISNDGQWVLFVVELNSNQAFQLRMIRVDGAGQQTLFCAPTHVSISASQWSFDQKYVVFNEWPASGGPSIYLLTMQTGTLQLTVSYDSSTNIGLVPRTWLDNTHVLLVGFSMGQQITTQNIYILDLKHGANQAMSDIGLAYNSSQSTCWNFDSSYDGQQLFITQCTPGTPSGSSKIIAQPANGGTATTLLDSSSLSVNNVRVINPQNTLLAIASDKSQNNPTGDTAHDGLYLIQSDGTTQRLASTPTNEESRLCPYSQYFWSNVSRNDSLYALENAGENNSGLPYTLSYGSLNGGTLHTFATDSQAITVVGWTTL